jgi:hypothetical protein
MFFFKKMEIDLALELIEYVKKDKKYSLKIVEN